MANATVTVTFDGKSKTFELDGAELSDAIQTDGRHHRYFTTASRDFVADGVMNALLEIVPEPLREF